MIGMESSETYTVNEEMTQLFCAETHDQLERLLAILLHLEADPGEQNANINEMFRIAHNIKGSSGMMGLNDLKELMHTVENMFDGVRKESIQLDNEKIDLLLNLSRQVMAYIETGNWQETNPFADWKTVIQDAVKAPAGENEIKEANLVLAGEEEQAIAEWQKAGNAVYGIDVEFSPDSVMPGAAAVIFSRDLERYGKIFKTAPDVMTLGEDNLHLKLVLMVEKELTPEQEKAITSYTGHGDMKLKLRKWTMRQEPARTPHPPKTEPTHEHTQVDQTIRVEFTKIDKLINDVQGLLSIQNALATIYEEGYQGVATWNRLGKAVRQLELAADLLQVSATGLRMVPIRQLFGRFPMIVRDVAKKKEKSAELKFFGEDTEIDKRMAEQLVNPLTHIIRNAVDHGLESPEARTAAGKNPVGTVTMGASQEGDRIVISVSDDGQGLNLEKIRKKALQKQLITEDESLKKEDILKLIFRPGFSTADQVSDISGRGVGLDVVHEAITTLKGDIEVESNEGEGTTFRLRVPLTLAIIQIFMGRVGGQNYGIPLDDVLGSLLIGRNGLERRADGLTYRLMDEDIPVVDLGEILGGEPTKIHPQTPLVIVKHNAQTFGVLIDEMTGQERVILKQINGALENNPLFSGAAFLNSGDMVLVLNSQMLIKNGSNETKGDSRWLM
jgi:two-component system chemotaxis sensor kinase CheA